MKQQFYSFLNSSITDTRFRIMAAGIDKKNYAIHDKKIDRQPLSLCLSAIITQLLSYVATVDDVDSIKIIAEKRGKREDRELLSFYHTMISDGSLSPTLQPLRSIIHHFEFQAKSDNNIGLQLVDLCAYPIARYMINSNEANLSFQILQPKLYRDLYKNTHWDGIEVFQ